MSLENMIKSKDKKTNKDTQTLSRAFLTYLSLALLLSLLIFSSGFDNYFASDDWPAILRNTTFSWDRAPEWFTTLRAGWYRPVHDVFINMCWQLFQLQPLGYRLVSIVVYAFVTAHVGLFVDVLTKDRRISFVAVILFTGFASHAEPVLWFAGTNELFAGLFVLISVISYILGREKHRPILFIISAVSSYLAYASKETALFFPILLLVYDGLLYLEQPAKERNYSFFLNLTPLLLVWVGFLLFRIPMGSAYATSFTFSLPGIVKNFVYYVLIGIFALPNNYAFVDAIPLWQSSPILPVIALSISLLSLSLLGWVWLHKHLWHISKYRKALVITAVWGITALGPVIFIVTERAVFMSTIGIVVFMSILIVGAWDAAKTESRGLQNLILLVAIGYLSINSYVLIYRGSWYGQSAALNEALLQQLEQELAYIPDNTKIVIANLPDHTQYTFTFRNTFPSSAILSQMPVNVVPILDSDLAEKSTEQKQDYVNQTAQKTDSQFIYWYQEGKLLRQQ